MSSPSDFMERSAVRASWVQLQSMHDPKLNRLEPWIKRDMAVRFVVGDMEDPSMNGLLSNEMEKYNDMIRVPCRESTEAVKKPGEFLKWAHATYNYKWAFITQDDSFVRLDTLLPYLEQLGTEKVYVGKVIADRPVARALDSTTPFKIYPPFVSGVGMGLSRDLVDIVVNNLPQLKYPLDVAGSSDVAMGNWFSGMTVTPINDARFHDTHEGCDKDMIVQGFVNPDVMKDTFINLVKGIPCHSHPFKKRTDKTEENTESLLSLSEGMGDDNEDNAESGFAQQMNSNPRADDDLIAKQMNFDLNRAAKEGIDVDEELTRKSFDMH